MRPAALPILCPALFFAALVRASNPALFHSVPQGLRRHSGGKLQYAPVASHVTGSRKAGSGAGV
jgi:hypothetical protein